MSYSRSFNRFVLVYLALLGLSVSSVNAATLNVVGGELLGASGVDVEGTLYDVTFVTGTCISEFDGCDTISDFDFNTESDALAASQALLDQVFLDVSAGLFDSIPSLTANCILASSCNIRTPYGFLNSTLIWFAFANNSTVESSDNNGSGAFLASDTDYTGTTVSFARWSPSVNPVPVPAAIWLFGTGIIGLIGFSRRRKAA